MQVAAGAVQHSIRGVLVAVHDRSDPSVPINEAQVGKAKGYLQDLAPQPDNVTITLSIISA